MMIADLTDTPHNLAQDILTINPAEYDVILAHGAWHKNSVWRNIAILFLDNYFHVAYPDFPYQNLHGKPIQDVTFEDYVDALRSRIEASTRKVILIGHSSAGLVLQELLGHPKVALYIFINAFIIPVGTCQFDHVPPEAAGFMTMLANARPDKCVPVLDQKFHTANNIPAEIEPFVESKLMAGENPEITRKLIEEELVPQALGLFTGRVSKDPATQANKAYLFCQNDMSLPPGAFLGMASLLGAEVFLTDGGHEKLYVNPQSVFVSLIQIIRKKLGLRS